MKLIQSYQSGIKTVPQARALLVGPVGAGKSSFFNSINSAFRGNMTSQAIAGTAGKSVTTQVLDTTLLILLMLLVPQHPLTAMSFLLYVRSFAPTPSKQGKVVRLFL